MSSGPNSSEIPQCLLAFQDNILTVMEAHKADLEHYIGNNKFSLVDATK